METKENSAAPAPGFMQELAACWQQLPNKTLFFVSLTAWMLLFQFYGNATFGYIRDSASLPVWMYKTYNNPMGHGEDGHGNLIPFVVLALFWWKRKELLALPHRTWWPGMLLLVFAVALHVFGYLDQQPKISIVALFTGIYALMGLAWGPEWLRKSFFPFFLFVFCIPISSLGQQVTVPLRLAVTKIVAGICYNILGMDVIREGNNLFNAKHTYNYEVAAACSGIQSLVAIFALSTIYAFMCLEKGWKRILMMAAGVPLAMLSNIVRMLFIICAAELYGQSGGNYVHDSAIFSVLPYIPAIFGVLWLGRLLREPSPALPLNLAAKPV
jgi:exosortase